MTTAEVDGLMPFYEKGAAGGGFEAGVRAALEAVLASPQVRVPPGTRAARRRPRRR